MERWVISEQHDQDVNSKTPILSHMLRRHTTKVYIYPHELPSGDYFLGGYIFAEIEKEKITLKRRKK